MFCRWWMIGILVARGSMVLVLVLLLMLMLLPLIPARVDVARRTAVNMLLVWKAQPRRTRNMSAAARATAATEMFRSLVCFQRVHMITARTGASGSKATWGGRVLKWGLLLLRRR